MTVGEKIRECRKARKLTQKQLGDKCGIAESVIRRYELGKLNPKAETLERIAEALEVPTNELLRQKIQTITQVPAIPGPLEDDHNMAELCFRNGEAHMKEKVIDLLMENKLFANGVCHECTAAIIQEIEKLG